MKKIINSSLFILLSAQYTYADEFTFGTQEITDKFCKVFTQEDENGTFCRSDKITYPIVESQDKGLEKKLNSRIKEQVGVFKKEEVRAYVLDTIKDEITTSMGHERELDVNILSVTPKTFSLEIGGYSYLGGAHGMSSIDIVDYDKVTGKKIALEELFIKDYQKELMKIVEKEYRKQERIRATDKLSDELGWFKNEFVLADVIGIGEDGLHLEYSSYEIKPYSGGTTSLVVDYALLKDIIKPDAYLSSFINNLKLSLNSKKEYSFFDKLLMMKLEVKRIAPDKIELTLMARNDEYDISKGGLSLSFPQIKEKSEIIEKSNKGFDKLSLYHKGSSVYHFKSKKNQKSDYLLVEGEAKKWKDNEEKSMKIVVKIPKNTKSFDIKLRATLLKNKKILQIPFDGVEGQQGVVNYQVKIPL
jgi:hypothetical protein